MHSFPVHVRRPTARSRPYGVAMLAAIVAVVGAAQLATPEPAAAVPGLELVHRDSTQFRDEPVKRADVTCPPGKLVIGGGGEVFDGAGTAVRLTSIIPFAEFDRELNRFVARTFGAEAQSHNGGRPYDWSLRGYAICALRSSLPGYALEFGLTSGTGPFQIATAVCPGGTVAYGSGASIGPFGAEPGKTFLQLNRTGGNHDLGRATGRAVPGFNREWTVRSAVMCAQPQGEIHFDGAISQTAQASDRCAPAFFSHGIGGGGGFVDGGPVWLDKIEPNPDLRGVDVSLTAPLAPAIGGMVAHLRCAR